MLRFLIERDATGAIATAQAFPFDQLPEGIERTDPRLTDRTHWKTFEQAAIVAAALGEAYLAIDAGPNVSPRYDVIAAPKVGDDVSKTINGDYYPCGKIVRVSPSRRKVVTDDGTVFYRRGENGGRWVSGGAWSMVKGRVSKLNPEF